MSDCVCLQEELNSLTFPKPIACIVTDGFKESLPVKRKYLGSNYALTDETRVEIKALITDINDVKLFVNWYCNEIDYGVKPFKIDLKLFGLKREWEVKLKSDLVLETINSSISKHISLKLELQENIGALISQNLEQYSCLECN